MYSSARRNEHYSYDPSKCSDGSVAFKIHNALASANHRKPVQYIRSQLYAFRLRMMLRISLKSFMIEGSALALSTNS